MGRSRDLQTDNVRIGFRFTEKLANELHQAISAQSRDEREVAQRCWETAQQMIDTIHSETNIEEYLYGKKQAPATGVASKKQPASKSKGSSKKDSSGAKASGGAGGNASGSDAGSSSAEGA